MQKMMENMKKCSKCLEVKGIDGFCKDKAQKDGFSTICKTCRNEHTVKWREANPKKVKELRVKYREANREKLKEFFAKWYKSNSEKVKERSTKWYISNLEKVKEYADKRKKANPEKVKVIQGLTKVCCKCKIEKSVDEFYKRKDRSCGIVPKCKKCHSDYHKTDFAKNKSSIYNKTEKAKTRYANFAKTEKGKATRKKYKESEKGLQSILRNGRKKVYTVSDRYVKELLKKTNYPQELINNPEFIEVKRLIIKTKRLCKTSRN